MIKQRDDTNKIIAIGKVIAKHLPKRMANCFEEFEDARGIEISYMVELAMARCGGMANVNGIGYDFIRVIDEVETRPECKTSSVYGKAVKRKYKEDYIHYVGLIRNVSRPSTDQEKEGDILALIYIPNTEGVKFFYIPKAWWANHVSTTGCIAYSYNPKTDSIPTFKDFECETFEDLCSPDRIGEWERLEAEIEAYRKEKRAADKLEVKRRQEEGQRRCAEGTTLKTVLKVA